MAVLQNLSGWLFLSDFSIPGASEVEKHSNQLPDFTVVSGAVEIASPDGVKNHPIWHALPNNDFALRLPGIGDFQICQGNKVIVQAADFADRTTIGFMLGGPVLAVLLYQRGLLPLDGAALRWRHGALLIVGPSGQGKSSLAAALAVKGWPVIADGVLGVRAGSSVPQLVRGAPSLRLWQRAADVLGVNLSGLTPLRAGTPRFQTIWPGEPSEATPISGIVTILNRSDVARCDRVSPARVLACLAQSLWSKPAYANDLSMQVILKDLGHLVSSMPCWQASPPENLEGIAGIADLLAKAVQM